MQVRSIPRQPRQVHSLGISKQTRQVFPSLLKQLIHNMAHNWNILRYTKCAYTPIYPRILHMHICIIYQIVILDMHNLDMHSQHIKYAHRQASCTLGMNILVGMDTQAQQCIMVVQIKDLLKKGRSNSNSNFPPKLLSNFVLPLDETPIQLGSSASLKKFPFLFVFS